MHFPINMIGVEDSVENYQSHLAAFCTVMVFESYEIHFFPICHSCLDLSHDFKAQICFHSHFIHCAYFSWLQKMSDRIAIRSKARQIAVMDPIYDPCCCACYLKSPRRKCHE